MRMSLSPTPPPILGLGDRFTDFEFLGNGVVLDDGIAHRMLAVKLPEAPAAEQEELVNGQGGQIRREGHLFRRRNHGVRVVPCESRRQGFRVRQ